MFGSTLALATGLMFLAVARFSGNPAAFGIVVFVGIASVATACALHIGAIVGELTFLRWPLRAVVIITGWVACGIGAVWLLSSAPGIEVLFGLLAAPATVGLAGVLMARRNRWWAVAFLGEAVALIALLGPVLFARLAS